MGSIFAYSITSSILLMAMCLIYKWVLAGENQHGYNRIILWAIYLCSLSLPILIPLNFRVAHSPGTGKHAKYNHRGRYAINRIYNCRI